MAEILTESFCERCGTRYTFESAAPVATKRLGKMKVLSKGLKNFVLDDNASLDEALAAARSEEDRASTSQQLDAFHETFNFCMSCRQYTCSNCWNEADARCLTCAPLPGADLLGAAPAKPAHKGRGGKAAKEAAKKSVDALAWPTTDLKRFENAASPTPEPPKPKPLFDFSAADREAAAAEAARGLAEAKAALDAESMGPAPAPPKVQPAPSAPGSYIVPEAWPDIPSISDRLKMAAAAPAKPSVPVPPVAPPVVPPPPEPVVAAAAPVTPEPVSPPAAQPPTPAVPDDDDSRAPTQTGGFLRRFGSGHSIDEVLDAFEAGRRESAAEIEAELSKRIAARQAAEQKKRPPEPIVEPEPIAEPEPEPEPVAYFTEPEPEAAPPPTSDVRGGSRRGKIRHTDDRVEVPTWQIVDPEPSRPAPSRPAPPPPPPAMPAPPQPRADARPSWPNEPAVDSLAFLRNRATPERGADEVWAASSRDLVANTGSPTAPTGVQPCVSCGLSLSATARFCRRCGTRQG